MTRTVSDPALKGRRDPLLDIYLQLHYFRRFVAAGCSGEPDALPLHYFYPLPISEVTAFRTTLTSLFARRRREGNWLEVEKIGAHMDIDMEFREAGRKFWGQQVRHRQLRPHEPVVSRMGPLKYKHPFENALAEINRRNQSPVICGRIEKESLLQSAPYWYELSRGRFGTVNLSPTTLIILTGDVSPDEFPSNLDAALCRWHIGPDVEHVWR